MHDDLELKWLELYHFVFLSVLQYYMSSLCVMFKSFWMVFWEHKIELVCFLSITEETKVLVNTVDDDILESED